MECPVEEILKGRIELLGRMQTVFVELNPNFPILLPRGKVQNEVLVRLSTPRTPANKRIVTEALEAIGYRAVKNRGTLFYRLTNREVSRAS